jgi:hypothetical protein
MVRIFSQYSIKKVFNLIFFLAFILVFGFTNATLAKTLIDKSVKCGQSSVKLIDGQSYLTSSSPNFRKVVSRIENVNLKDYNLIISLGHKPSPGYRINIPKIKMKKKSVIIYYSEEKFSNTALTVISYPYCLIKIENLDNRKIKIKKKRLKFFPFNIF